MGSVEAQPVHSVLTIHPFEEHARSTTQLRQKVPETRLASNAGKGEYWNGKPLQINTEEPRREASSRAGRKSWSDCSFSAKNGGMHSALQKFCRRATKKKGNPKEEEPIKLSKLRPGLEPGISSLLVMRFTAKPPELVKNRTFLRFWGKRIVW
jgi:hypothetical protein